LISVDLLSDSTCGVYATIKIAQSIVILLNKVIFNPTFIIIMISTFVNITNLRSPQLLTTYEKLSVIISY